MTATVIQEDVTGPSARYQMGFWLTRAQRTALSDLARKWDTDEESALLRAVGLAYDLQDAARTGHKVLVRHPRRRLSVPAPWRRSFYTEVLAVRWKGPRNP